MARFEKSEHDEKAPKDRLIGRATDSFISTYIARRRPVAFVGSGLSLVYGGVTWDEAVDIILEEALDRLQRTKWTASIDGVRVDRMRGLIHATLYRDRDERLEASEKYVALELAQEAFTLAQVIDPVVPGQAPISANDVFSKLASDDAMVITRLLARRFAAEPAEDFENDFARRDADREARGKRFIDFLNKNLTDEQDVKLSVTQFAAEFYMPSLLLDKLPPELGAVLREVLDDLEKDNIRVDQTLPIDRRSFFAPFLGACTPDERKAIFDAAHIAAECARGHVREGVVRPLLDPLLALRTRLYVSRFLTLNYDFELENLLMMPDLREQLGRSYGVERAIADGAIDRDIGGDGEIASYGLSRRLAEGNYVASEVYRPGAAARLFEFALNSPDHSAHIVHLHGRADHPEDMVARDDDYNRFYRRAGQGRESLERALDVTLLGNPILFVGIGLTEAEITRAFRQMVADGRIPAGNPAFALMPMDKYDRKTGKAGLKAWREQTARFQLYGLHLLHYGHPRRGGKLSLPIHLVEIDRAKDRAKELRDKGSAVAADEDLVLKLRGDLGFIDAIRGDAVVWDWLAGLLPRSGADIVQELKLVSNEAEGIKRFADGVLDFLEKLRPKTYSAALEAEIGALSESVRFHSANVHENLVPRVLSHLPAQDWYRHLPSAQKQTPIVAQRIDAVLNDPVFPKKTGFFRKLTASIEPTNIFIQGEEGAGKGAVLSALRARAIQNASMWHLTINLNFGIEIDSVLLTIIKFLCAFYGQEEPATHRLMSLEKILSEKQSIRRRAMIMFIGVERLFDSEGQPVSADFAKLLEILSRRKTLAVDLVIIAHPRIKEVWERCEPVVALKTVKIPDPDWEIGFHGRLLANIDRWLGHAVSARWPEKPEIERRVKRERINFPCSENELLDAAGLSEALLWIVLDYWSALGGWEASGVPAADPTIPSRGRSRKAALDLGVLFILSLIGAPVESVIISHAPRVRQLLRSHGVKEQDFRAQVEASLNTLVDFGLVRCLTSDPLPGLAGAEIAKDDPGRKRYALHRTVLKFMRNRLGVPLGEGRIANSYSLTLAASLPLDTMIPDQDIQGELKSLIGHFRSTWKDQHIPDDLKDPVRKLEDSAHKGSSPISAEGHFTFDSLRQLERIILMQVAPSSAALRAASNLVRSFFSAASLVTTDPIIGASSAMEPSEFEAHKRRVQDIFIRIRDLQFADKKFRRIADDLMLRLEDPDKIQLQLLSDKYERLLSDLANRPPLFGAEVLWLHNERGVIALLQGDLYEAEFSFSAALKANRHYKGSEGGDGPLHNFVRIQVNRSLLLIERGKLIKAEHLLEETKGVSLNRGIESEKLLLDPIITGYQGLVAHLMGKPTQALKLYSDAIEVLEQSDQQRALGLSLMRRASLNRVLNRMTESEIDVRRAVLAAEAGRQIDLLWRARLVRKPMSGQEDEHEALAYKALAYGEAAGILRVEVEALLALIGINEDRRNFEKAMQLTARAMILALRGGMVLRRIGLRVVMGRLMLKSGDPSGEFLLRRAIDHADRIGYGAAVERAQQALSRI